MRGNHSELAVPRRVGWVPLTLASVAVVVSLAMLSPLASAAATITVDTSGDPAAPDCATGHPAGTCSLRGAVAAAAAGDTVVIAAGMNPVLTTGEIAIDRALTVQGQGARATSISGNNASRVFNVIAGGDATISAVTLTAGSVTGSGGALYIDAGASGSLTDVAVTGSTATNGAGNALGGGIINRATLTLVRVTVSGNNATGDGAAGGGIANGGTLTATNSTISDNTATGSGTLSVTGGGVYDYGSATLTNLTVASNRATTTGTGQTSGGGITTTGVGATVTLKNTIVAYGTAAAGSNCLTGPGGASFASQGGNLETTTPSQCGLAGPPGGSDLIGVDPLLGSLADNGGQTDTRALPAGSPAVDAVPAANCPPPGDDQRLIARPQGPLCDIGAFEAAPAPAPTPGPGSSPPAGTPPSNPPPDFAAAVRRCNDLTRPRSSISDQRRLFSRRQIRFTGRTTDQECSPQGQVVRTLKRLARVEVSISTKRGRSCRFLTSAGRLAARSCASPVWIPTKTISFDPKNAKTTWAVVRAVNIPAGSYTAIVRGTDRDRNVETAVRRTNRADFKIK